MMPAPGEPVQMVTVAITDSVIRWPPFDNGTYTIRRGSASASGTSSEISGVKTGPGSGEIVVSRPLAVRPIGARRPVRAQGPAPWVDVPQRAELALEGMRPNPSEGGDGLIRFSLTGTGPARLELLDISGRRVAQQDLGSFGPGRHEIRFDSGVRLAAGVYLLRLIEGKEIRTARAAVMR